MLCITTWNSFHVHCSFANVAIRLMAEMMLGMILMRLKQFVFLRVSLFFVLLLMVPQFAYAQNTPVFGYRIVNVYPHDPEAFIQGLFVKDGYFYESTGQYGSSTLRKVDIKSGEVLQKQAMSDIVFGEGITHWNGRIISLTWRSGIGFTWDEASFKRLSQFKYEGEGWGLTHNHDHLIMSDGTPTLRFLNPETMEVEGRVDVSANGRKIPYVNELEWIDGTLYANIWQSNYIAQINPETGEVQAWINLNGLLDSQGPRVGNPEVLNGIADAGEGRLYVTGKRWPYLFEIEVLRD